MPKTKRRYWALRTDRFNKALLFSELRAGRLRQGWGNHPSQDLRLVQAEIAKGGKWWARLSEKQNEVLRHLKMLSSAEDGMKVGDLILAPNMPEDGYFVIAEVAGDYFYQPLELSKKQDVWGTGKDYGHVVPVRLITDKGIDKYADGVDAKIRSTLRNPGRMWALDHIGEAIEEILGRYQSGADMSAATSGEARLNKAWRSAMDHASEALRQKLGPELDKRFQAAEWEEPIKKALEDLYPGAEVRWVGGPKEYGADVIVQIPNHFGDLPWLILVQVKNYTGEIDEPVLDQMRTAYSRYHKEGKVLSLVVMTTAERKSQGLAKAAQALQDELGIPVEVVLRSAMLNLLSQAALSQEWQVVLRNPAEEW